MSFNFSKILPNGHFRLDFSETFHKLETLWTGDRNFTLLNILRHEILELNFTSELEYELQNTKQAHLIPTIDDWLFVNHTEFFFDLDINFTNPLNISQNIIKDTLKARVIHNWPFVSQKSGYSVKTNYTTEDFELPCQALSAGDHE